MAIARPILGLVAIVLLAGGILLQFFVILSGATYGGPENQIYFLQASTTGVTGASNNPTRWTYFSLCGVDTNGDNTNCGSVTAALPFSPVQNFDTDTGLPTDFADNQNYYYYLSRFAWVFYIIALFFAVIAFLISLVALCSRLGAYLTGTTTFLAFFFQALAASLMTAWTVKGRNEFIANGQTATLGVKAYGFTWAAFACWFLAMLFFCIGGGVSKDSTQKRSYFGRKRSTRSRGSFIDTESQRRVKDEYD